MISVFNQTESLCPVCLKKVKAFITIENNDVYIEKRCKEHGYFKVLIWRDKDLYKSWGKESVHADKVSSPAYAEEKGCPYDCGLCSDHEGGTCTAVIEITNNCNMKCPVCFASANEIDEYDPDLNEIEAMYRTVINSNGKCSVQLSGGEPTIREDLPEILKMGKSMGFEHIQVNTNGLRISEDTEYPIKLKDSGADLIYLQFDGVDDEVYKIIRGKRMLDIKLKAIENCKNAGIGVLLVPVIIKDVNLDKVGEIIEFAKNNMPYIKGIHFQPVSYFGRYPKEGIDNDARTTLSDVIQACVEQVDEISIKNLIPRKRYDSHCAFSSLFVLDENNKLQPITQQGKETEEIIKEKITEFKNNRDDITNNDYFSESANKFTNKNWRLAENSSESKDNFYDRLKNYRLSITGMPFQDVWNVDIERLKGCCVHVVGNDNRLVPLCAYHITSTSGKRLYQNRKR